MSSLELNDTQKSLRATFASTFSITLVFVCLRFYARARLQAQFSTDDYFLVAALVFFAIGTALCLYAIEHAGFGRKTAELTPAMFATGLTCEHYGEIAFNSTLILSKLSVAFLQLRIMGITHKTMRMLHWISIGVNVSVGIAIFFIYLIDCYLTIACKQQTFVTNSVYVYSAFNILLDWYYASVIVFLIWKLQQTRPIVKFSMSIILGMGLFASIAPIVRLKFIKGLAQSPDPLYVYAPIFSWSWIEVCLSMCASSIATFRPLLRVIPGLSSSTGDSGNYRNHASPFTTWKSRIRPRSRRGLQLNDLEYTVKTQIGDEEAIAAGARGQDGLTMGSSSVAAKDRTEVQTFPDDAESQKSILRRG